MRYIFAVLGSDHASLIDGYEKRKQAGKLAPELLIFDHEVSSYTCVVQFSFFLAF